MTLIGSLRRLFTRRDKKILIGLLCLSIVVSVFETVGISVLMLFITMATNFELIQKNQYLASVNNFFNFAHPANFVIAVGCGLIVFYFARAALNITLTYSLSNFSQTRQQRFAKEMFRRFLLLDYKDFTMRNSTTVGQAIFTFTAQTTQVINGLLSIVTESFTIMAIYAMLFYVNWKMTLVLSVLLGLKVFGIIKIFSGRITAAGRRAQQLVVEVQKQFGRIFSNYKFCKLLANEEPEVNLFDDLTKQVAKANNVNMVWQSLPRFILETIGFSVLIGVIVYVLFWYRNAQFVIPIVSMYALAFYRFLPSVNKILTSYNQILFNKHAIEPLAEYQNLECEDYGLALLSYTKTIKVHHIAFSYMSARPIIREASLVINQGEKIGFIGESGAGKTTLVDILVGLLKQDSGTISIDGVELHAENLLSWRRMIGYIPQQIYLFDGTAADNVLCGRSRNEEMLVRVLKQANMYDFLMDKGGLEVRVGEAGIQLSGGQRQRLAIARALYGNPPVLVLDEATSSLDNENEERIMREVYDNATDCTMLVIAHRLSTIARCDRVFKVINGSVVELEKPAIHQLIMPAAQAVS